MDLKKKFERILALITKGRGEVGWGEPDWGATDFRGEVFGIKLGFLLGFEWVGKT